MAAYEEKTGSEVLAIAHNGNSQQRRHVPDGRGVRQEGRPRSTRRPAPSWERLYEVTQTKGTGEAHPFLSPNDEFASFELWDKGNLDGSVAKTKEMLEFEYARSALENGLVLEQKLGINPYKFGMIGSSDAHTGLAAMEEDNFFGKTAPQEPSPERLTKPSSTTRRPASRSWTGRSAPPGTPPSGPPRTPARRSSTRCSGARPTPRPARAWWCASSAAGTSMPGRAPTACRRVDRLREGRADGRRSAKAPKGKAPTFLVAALKDPIGANLDRIQIVKGWVDEEGKTCRSASTTSRSRSGAIEARTADGKVPSVGSTVDVENATWTNTIGAPELIAVWKDPEFDARQRAFYYVPRARDPDAALDRLRRQALRHQAQAPGAPP
jgi:hypothetical protein